MKSSRFVFALAAAGLIAACSPADEATPTGPLFKPAARSNGTTLAASKTLDVCETTAGSGVGRFSGEVSVWNEGVLDTQGLTITDWIQHKFDGVGGAFTNYVNTNIVVSGQVPAGTTLATATVFPYSVDAPLEAGATYRNSAVVQITNHSGQLGTLFGPNPKFTFVGEIPVCPETDILGCSYTQGYWGNKPGVVWPAPYGRGDAFFLSGQTWQQVMDTPVAGNAYYNLAHQYMAAVLNAANGAFVPAGVQANIDLADAWFAANAPSACPTGGSCGTQKTWAGILDSYNKGEYPGGPPHCGDE